MPESEKGRASPAIDIARGGVRSLSGGADAGTVPVRGSAPNSAAAERVFSLMKNMFGDLSMSSLADYIQAALMLKYNKRTVG